MVKRINIKQECGYCGGKGWSRGMLFQAREPEIIDCWYCKGKGVIMKEYKDNRVNNKSKINKIDLYD